ncbi:MAG: redoxin domain-containing protein [Bacteroidota bacterium]
MKYLTVIIIAVLSLVFYSTNSAKSAADQATNIHIKVNGLSSNWIYLHDVYENKKSRIDSAFVDDQGNAYFKRDELFAQGYYNLILPDSTVLDVLLDEDQVFSLETTYPNLVTDMQITGSTENEILYTLLKYEAGMGDQFQIAIQQLQANGEQEIDQNAVEQIRQNLFAKRDMELAKLYGQYPNTLFTQYQKAQEAPKEILNEILTDQSIDENERTFLMLDHYWDNVDFSDSRLLHTPVIFNRLTNYFYQYSPNQTMTKLRAIDVLMNKVTNHPDYYKFFAVWIAESYEPQEESNIDKEALYVHMVDNYLNEKRAFWADSTQVYAWQLRAGYRAKSLIGKKGQNIEAKDPQGNTKALYDIQTPYVAIFFYHAECDHCQETAPKLAKVHQEWKDRGLEVYAVSMDTPEKEWKEFLVKYKMEDMVNVSDEDNFDIYSNYYVLGTPYVYLLNPNRTIIGKNIAVEDIPKYMMMDQQAIAEVQRQQASNQ